MPSEPSTRTQIYLTDAQRRRLDAFCRTRGIAMAEAVREAVDAYLDREYVSCVEALDRTWGSAPKAEVPSRDEWDAPRERGDRTERPSSHPSHPSHPAGIVSAVGGRPATKPATKPASTQGPVRPSERSEAPLGGGRASRARKPGGGVGRTARRKKRKRA